MDAHYQEHHLVRSRSSRMLFGVCGGLGDYFEIDPVIVRLAFVLITLAGGAGVLAYIILALVMPDETAESVAGRAALRQNVESLRVEGAQFAQDVQAGLRGAAFSPEEAREVRRHRNHQVLGLILIGLGILFVPINFGWWSWLNWAMFWPLTLIILGIAILLGRTSAR